MDCINERHQVIRHESEKPCKIDVHFTLELTNHEMSLLLESGQYFRCRVEKSATTEWHSKMPALWRHREKYLFRSCVNWRPGVKPWPSSSRPFIRPGNSHGCLRHSRRWWLNHLWPAPRQSSARVGQQLVARQGSNPALNPTGLTAVGLAPR